VIGRRLAVAALAAALLACGVRAPPRPPETSHRAVVEPATVGTTSGSSCSGCAPTFRATSTTTEKAP
jgi:hypothetical protein